MLRFVVLALMLAYVSAMTPNTACVSPDPTTLLEVGTCTTDTCTFQAGSTIHVKYIFKAPFNTDTFVAYADMTVGGTVLPTSSRAQCGEITSANKCPLVSGTSYTVEYDFVLPANIPTGQGTITVTRKDKNCKVISCNKIKVKIVASK